VVFEDRGDLEVTHQLRKPVILRVAIWIAAAALTLTIAAASPLPPCDNAASLAESQSTDKAFRDARKEMKRGNYDKAAKIYEGLVVLDPSDLQARLGASFAYLKLGNYVRCYDEAQEALKQNPKSARAHSLASVALLRSGYIRHAVAELQTALTIDRKEALAFGCAAEIDYYEGRVRDAREKSLYAHNLDPDEPDFLITYARASSRAEDFKEAADAYELFLQVAPRSDHERLERIRGLIQFYRQLSGIQVHQVSGAETAEAPFALGSDRRPYIKVKINGREGTFVIDTGSGFTVISKEAARKFGVSEIARGGKSQGVGGSGKFQIVYGLIRSLDIGEARLRMIPCFIRSFHTSLERPANERADGFLGLSILSHYTTELDYKDGVLRLNRGDERPFPVAGTGVTVIPFRTTQNGLISVETEFDGNNTINAILDSGASSTVISVAAVERLKLRDQIIKGQTANVIGAAGVTENVQLLFIRNCRVANLEQNNLRALVLDFNAINETSGFEQSGILGGDFLRHFKVTIDFNRALLALQRHSEPPLPQ
jgi:tetratricopeptide (TPR) repeat protein